MDNAFAVVVDLETTGLSPTRDVPLELAAAIVDPFGDILAHTEYLIWETLPEYNYYGAVDRAKNHSIVGPMHENSGLWSDLDSKRSATKSPNVVDNALCDWLTSNGVEFGTLPMMGNSIGSLDRPFCFEWFPMFSGALSYRNVDVSSFKVAAKALNPVLWSKMEPLFDAKHNGTVAHRALDDVRACAYEWSVYVENFLFVEVDD